jgi:universal stress protein E
MKHRTLNSPGEPGPIRIWTAPGLQEVAWNVLFGICPKEDIMTLKTLLVGLDFKSTIDATLDMAIALSSRLGCDLLLCHAIEDYVPTGYETDFEEEKELLRRANIQLAQREEALRGRGARGRALDARIGPPHKVLLQLADVEDVDAILIGVSDRSSLERLFLGSSAEKVTRSSRRPVFLRHPQDAELGFSSIMCAVDYSEHATHTLRNAVALARSMDAVLHVLHVQAAPVYAAYADLPVVATPAPSVADPEAKKALEAFIDKVDTTGVRVEPYLRVGPPCTEILAGVREMKPGFLVMGKHQHSRVMDFLLGSVATDILRDVPSSMLVIGKQDLPLD